jgi:acyl-CoA synthetase (AMP-forming)/AMP-acid ligase II
MTGLRAGDRYLMIPPYFTQFGYKAGILACLVAGAVMLPEAVFHVDAILARVQREKVTVLPGPPTLYQSIVDHPDRYTYDLSSLRVAVTGAADIPVELIRRIHEELPFTTIIAGYEMTEGGRRPAPSRGTSSPPSPPRSAGPVPSSRSASWGRRATMFRRARSVSWCSAAPA